MRRARATGLDVDYNTTFAAFSNQIGLACELRCFPSEDKTVLFFGEDRVAFFLPISPGLPILALNGPSARQPDQTCSAAFPSSSLRAVP